MSLSVEYLGMRRRAAERAGDQVTARLAAAFGVDPAEFRVRVGAAANGSGPVVAQVNLVLGGRPFRTQAACASPEEVADVLVARLARQMTLLAGGPTVRPWPDPLYAAPPNPVGPAVITRRKRPVLRTMTADAALRELDARDYQAHLFIDAQTRAEALVYRAGPCGYRMTRAVCGDRPVSVPALLVLDMAAAPVLTLAGALGRLTAFGEDYLFFTDVSAGRGALLYGRYAEGYGLIEPAV